MKKRKSKKKKAIAPPKIARRQKALQAEINARKRGVRVDFTAMKLGATTQFNKIIAECPECKLLGQVSDAAVWGNCVLMIHRGLFKEERLKMTEFCVATRMQLVYPKVKKTRKKRG